MLAVAAEAGAAVMEHSAAAALMKSTGSGGVVAASVVENLVGRICDRKSGGGRLQCG